MKQLEFLTQYEVEMTTTGTAATEYFIMMLFAVSLTASA